MLFWEKDYALPPSPSEGEARLVAQLGAEGLQRIDTNLVHQARRHSLKVARVVIDALKAGGFSLQDEICFDLHVRRLIVLVESGVLVGLGNLCRPAWSEVHLPE